MGAFPWLRQVPIIGELGYHKIERNVKQVSYFNTFVNYHKFIEEEVTSQMKEYDGESEPDNFVHA
ncbi:Protein CBG28014 [Caenorhabditis briggsae]|uniref:Protein CBG28014 n=1 Tax=Caenorhabditis briggsae TaxID=6238 RepID=B6IG10_CAEBR|nr:Protein CBG28014 [Caenorhabditis briggsae]CAR98840.1 Protein CBG28014 [Caenorhabditis briggsae]